jgi:hypothetical protein
VRVNAVGTDLEYAHDVVERERTAAYGALPRRPEEQPRDPLLPPNLSSMHCSPATKRCCHRGTCGPGDAATRGQLLAVENDLPKQS